MDIRSEVLDNCWSTLVTNNIKLHHLVLNQHDNHPHS